MPRHAHVVFVCSLLDSLSLLSFFISILTSAFLTCTHFIILMHPPVTTSAPSVSQNWAAMSPRRVHCVRFYLQISFLLAPFSLHLYLSSLPLLFLALIPCSFPPLSRSSFAVTATVPSVSLTRLHIHQKVSETYAFCPCSCSIHLCCFPLPSSNLLLRSFRSRPHQLS